MLRDRPFMMAFVANQLRKVAIYYFNAKQFSEAEFDQFVAKTRTLAVMQALCDAVEELDFDWKNPRKSVMKYWNLLRPIVDSFDNVDIEHPEMFYNMAPTRKGRKARRAMEPPYEEDPRFIADKALFEAELRGEHEKETDNTVQERTD